MITLTTSQTIFIIIGVSVTVNTLCKFLFWLDTPRKHTKHHKYLKHTSKD